ncbi:MAG: LD-carboxypeptidase [Draconibacterium sp.]|nr:LD-carboxypeptidase [Draconibacterium sp.]
MISPTFLKPGSKLQIVSPAGKVKKEPVLLAVEWLEKQGYKVELGKHVFAKYFQFAGTDAQRLEDLQTAFDDPETDAVICSRGGYGTIRIIDQLNFTKFKNHPKWLVGFSDITILHSILNNLGVATIHGAMPPFFFEEKGEPNESLGSLMNLLIGKNCSYNFAINKHNKPGNITAELVGGNLSIIASLLGTKYELKAEGKILFIEEIDEYLYHIDRMMCQLKLAGKLDKLAGLVIGDFTEIKDNDSPFGQTVEEIIIDAVKDYSFPVCFGFPAGHNIKNLALTFGKKWNLNVSSKTSTLNLI